MPKVLGHTPQWLQRPSPGHQLFAPKPSTSRALATKDSVPGLRRTIATRNAEIFVAAGHEIRWADLTRLKDDESPAYRTFKISIPLPIERLTISPTGEYLAVSTSHTVHVVVLPEPALLHAADNAPIKPKTFQVGPTAHVREESPIASVLWHPLGYHGRCLVTITHAGVVRLWEINRADRSSFCETTLSIDMQKLANAQTDEDDLGASRYGATKGFSPDYADLEVASACFGDSPDQEGVHGWAPMTLWIATVSGDVYALCPILPEKWQLVENAGAATFKKTLISSINVNYADVDDHDGASKEDDALADKQIKWLSDIVFRDAFTEELSAEDTITVFKRPDSVPAVPLLQGPFSISPEVEDFELSDMIVYSLKTFSGEEDEIADGLPSAVVCLLTDTCEVHVCLDLDGVVGRWLPSAEDDYVPRPLEHELTVVETIALAGDGVSSPFQSITPDTQLDFSFFVSHSSGVFYVSLEQWVRNLEAELSNPQSGGIDFRLERLLESANTIAEYCIRRNPKDRSQDVTACTVVFDGHIGYMVLTSVDNEPQAVFLDTPDTNSPPEEYLKIFATEMTPVTEMREPWQPPKDFWATLDLHGALQAVRRSRASWHDEINLSPANLEILMTAHRLLAEHTERLQVQVSDLFTRCHRLQDEFRDQIERTAKNLARIDSVTGKDDARNGVELYGSKLAEDRKQKVEEKHRQQSKRLAELKRKLASVNTQQPSDKERQLVEELQTMEASLDKNAARLTDDIDGSNVTVWERVSRLQERKEDLSRQVEQGTERAGSDQRSSSSMRVPLQSRQREKVHIEALLDQQGDLLEATIMRLTNQGIKIPEVPKVDS